MEVGIIATLPWVGVVFFTSLSQQVATAVREQQQLREESSKRVERANLGLTVLVKKLERSLFVSELYLRANAIAYRFVPSSDPNQ